MIELKFYTEKEGRDPNIYLGIDESPIPFALFKGMFSKKGNLYTDSGWGDVQLLVNDDEKTLLLVSDNPDAYITIEDIQSTDIWYKIGFDFPEKGYTTFMSIQDSLKNDPLTLLLERYRYGSTLWKDGIS